MTYVPLPQADGLRRNDVVSPPGAEGVSMTEGGRRRGMKHPKEAEGRPRSDAQPLRKQLTLVYYQRI